MASIGKLADDSLTSSLFEDAVRDQPRHFVIVHFEQVPAYLARMLAERRRRAYQRFGDRARMERRALENRFTEGWLLKRLRIAPRHEMRIGRHLACVAGA